MKKPITVLGSGRPADSSSNSSAALYALIPLLLGLPIIAYFFAQIYHLPVGQFAPPIFAAVAMGLGAIFAIASKPQRDAKRAERKKEIQKDL